MRTNTDDGWLVCPSCGQTFKAYTSGDVCDSIHCLDCDIDKALERATDKSVANNHANCPGCAWCLGCDT